jgi:glucose-1-phosphate cytidylyltransferase
MMKVVILCGGRGSRLNEETEFKPKPLVTIGGIPILVHIMRTYAHYGYKDFILCLGYKGEMIKEYFMNKEAFSNDFSMNLKSGSRMYHTEQNDNWNITFVDTGLETMTGARIKRIEKFIDGPFHMTYGDGIADIDISSLVNQHLTFGRIGTMTCVHPHSKYGLVKLGENHQVEDFAEKRVLHDYINGGFFIFEKGIFDYLSEDEKCVLEVGPLNELVADEHLTAYKHDGFWHCLDTFKDYVELNEMWNNKLRPWVKL